MVRLLKPRLVPEPWIDPETGVFTYFLNDKFGLVARHTGPWLIWPTGQEDYCIPNFMPGKKGQFSVISISEPLAGSNPLDSYFAISQTDHDKGGVVRYRTLDMETLDWTPWIGQR